VRVFREHSDDRARQHELNVRAQATGAVPAARAVEKLAPARTQPRTDVLEIGRGGRGGPERGGIERAAPAREQGHPDYAGSDLEATIGDVLVRHPIGSETEQRTEGQRGEPRAGQRTERTPLAT